METTTTAETTNWKDYSSWDTLLTELEEEAKTHRDVRGLRGRDLAVEGTQLVVDGSLFEMDDFALSQFAKSQGTRINAAYWTTYFKTEVWNEQANHILQTGPHTTKPLLIRLDDGNTDVRGKFPQIRGILQDSYSPFDYAPMVEMLLEKLGTQGYIPGKVHRDRKSMSIRCVKRDVIVSQTVGDIQRGVFCPNSEVGASSVGAFSYLQRLICTNGLVDTLKSAGASRRHVGDVQTAFRDALDHAITYGDTFLEATKQIAVVPVEYPHAVLQRLAEQFKMPKKRGENLIEAYDQEPNPTQWGVLNALTRAAQWEESITARVNLERIAGTIVRKPRILQKIETEVSEALESID